MFVIKRVRNTLGHENQKQQKIKNMIFIQTINYIYGLDSKNKIYLDQKIVCGFQTFMGRTLKIEH
jgi:hypothetical protein